MSGESEKLEIGLRKNTGKKNTSLCLKNYSLRRKNGEKGKDKKRFNSPTTKAISKGDRCTAGFVATAEKCVSSCALGGDGNLLAKASAHTTSPPNPFRKRNFNTIVSFCCQFFHQLSAPGVTHFNIRLQGSR